MRVPGPVKAVFDQFPLKEYPEISNHSAANERDVQLFVYNVGPDHIAMDPNGLAVQTLMKVLGKDVEVALGSPYMTKNEKLPLLVLSGRKRGGSGVYSGLDEILGFLVGEEEKLDGEMELFKVMLDKWLNEAWLATILSEDYEKQCLMVYSSDRDRSQPWPANRIITNQLLDHLGAQGRHRVVRHFNSHTTSMALHSLATKLGDAEFFSVGQLACGGNLGLLDILVYSYIWSIFKHIPNSALASLVPLSLSEHARRVHQYVYNSSE